MRQKVAGTCILGLLLHLVFSSVAADYNLALAYWLAYCLICGTIINYEGSTPDRQLALLSIPSPAVVVTATYYRALFRGTDACWLSGIQCKVDAEFIVRSLVFVLASVGAIWVSSYLAQWLLTTVQRIFKLTDARAKLIRGRIVWLGSVVLAIVGVFEIIAHGWRGD